MKLQRVPRSIAPPNATVAPTGPLVISDDEGQAMAGAAVKLFQRWRLADWQACVLLGGISSATFGRWKRGEIGRLTIDQKTRLSTLMGIHKALRILFTESDRVYGWVSKPNTAFEGRSALEVMLQGQIADLTEIRQYLDAVRG